MSYEISYRRQAFVLPAAKAGYWDDICFLLEEGGSNNCYECDSNRRSRNWECLAAGAQYHCMHEVVTTAAACCGGSLVLNGRRGTKPEAYIRAWRNAISEALPLTSENLRGFGIELYVAIGDREAEGNRRYAFETLSKLGAPVPRRYHNALRDTDVTEWRFDLWNPEQVRLWLDNRPGGRGWHSVRANGPA